MVQQKKDQNNEAMDKSHGGLITKIHAVVDALGNPVLHLTAGQTSEYTQAEALIDGFNVDYVLVDKGYDSDQFVRSIIAQKATPVICRRGIGSNQEFMIKRYVKNETSLSDSSKS